VASSSAGAGACEVPAAGGRAGGGAGVSRQAETSAVRARATSRSRSGPGRRIAELERLESRVAHRLAHGRQGLDAGEERPLLLCRGKLAPEQRAAGLGRLSPEEERTVGGEDAHRVAVGLRVDAPGERHLSGSGMDLEAQLVGHAAHRRRGRQATAGQRQREAHGDGNSNLPRIIPSFSLQSIFPVGGDRVANR